MYKIELTTRELATLQHVTELERHRAEKRRDASLRAYHDATDDKAIAEAVEAVDYWREQTRVLNQIVGKLRQVEEAGQG